MVLFTISTALRDHIRTCGIDNEKSEQLMLADHISDSDLVALYKKSSHDTLIAFIRSTNSRLYIPNKNDRNDQHPKTKEFLASMKKLRLKAKEEEYQRLIRPSEQFTTLYDNHDLETLTPAAASKELKNQVTTIVNVLISVGSVVYAVWYWTDSSMKMKDSWRVLLCLFSGVLVLVAEVVVYMGYLNRIEDAKIRERKKKEVKKVVRVI
ncbi:Vacuolar ATPase assembly integral membrane protein [Meyerozyma sp. JA9]|nr:Vacuolar ATPase assembly integral membrane protein [Meyerozyma sp. JA9]